MKKKPEKDVNGFTKNSFPEHLYVTLSEDDGIVYPVAYDSLDDADEGLVGEYKLVRVGTKHTKTVIEYK